MWDDVLKAPQTAHTSNQVPFVIAGPGANPSLRSGGALCDVAPTILGLMGLARVAADLVGVAGPGRLKAAPTPPFLFSTRRS